MADEPEHMAAPKQNLCKLIRKDVSTKLPDPQNVNSNVHHIVPCTCIAKRSGDYPPGDGNAEYIESCLDMTPWDLNADLNLVRLPRKKQYMLSLGLYPVDQPCHDSDHLKFIDEVSLYLKTEVWATLKAEKDGHKINAKSIEQQLLDASTLHRTFLDDRGGREPGTAVAWKKRNDAAYKTTWYLPFSMAMDGQVTPRTPTPDTNLTHLFLKL